MIDWTKPIETVDGHPAKVISDDFRQLGGSVVRLVQYENEAHSTVSTVNELGQCTCLSEALIRNRTVKREGWVVIYRGLQWEAHGKIYDNKVDADLRGTSMEAATGCEWNVARIEWEEPA
ncbi:MAG: hypothetical protein ING08_08095 [Roseomonas sp.]|nr:hypothetical protein [Roseomonas sp.]